MSERATRTIRQAETFAASPEFLYNLWLDGDSHAGFTGGGATSDARVGGEFTAWNGYITGTHLELEPGRRLLQSWQTSEWPADAAPSRLELTFEGTDKSTTITLLHTVVPAEQSEAYRQGWIDHYWKPLATYLAQQD